MEMYNKIKEGYNLFIRKTENKELIGTLTLKENDSFKCIEQLEFLEMEFIMDYKTITDNLDQEHALFITYDIAQQQLLASIQEKTNIGEYNDIITWNNIIISKNSDLLELLHELDKKIQTKLEGSF